MDVTNFLKDVKLDNIVSPIACLNSHVSCFSNNDSRHLFTIVSNSTLLKRFEYRFYGRTFSLTSKLWVPVLSKGVYSFGVIVSFQKRTLRQ